MKNSFLNIFWIIYAADALMRSYLFLFSSTESWNCLCTKNYVALVIVY